MQEQFKELREEQLVAREVEIMNQGRVFVRIEMGKLLDWSEFGCCSRSACEAGR